MTGNGARKRPMLLGDKVRLTGGREFAVVGTVASRGLGVVLLAAWGQELAPMFTYPGTQLTWSEPLACWVGELGPRLADGRMVLRP